jgi:PhnB protein
MPMPDGKVGHAEMQIGGARVMLSDEFPEWGNLSPLSIGGSATTVLIYFEDVDAVVDRAVSAGAKLSNRRRTSSGETKLQLQDISGHVDVLQPARKTSPKR